MSPDGDLLSIEPLELKFPCKFPFPLISFHFSRVSKFWNARFDLIYFSVVVELKKQISCSLQLSNKTDSYVAFKVTIIFLLLIFVYFDKDFILSFSFAFLVRSVNLILVISVVVKLIWFPLLVFSQCWIVNHDFCHFGDENAKFEWLLLYFDFV